MKGQGSMARQGKLKIKKYVTLSIKPSIVKRGITFSIIVGTILISINHGDTILSGELTNTHIFKMVLTYFVPYFVSTLSSVQALMKENEQ